MFKTMKLTIFGAVLAVTLGQQQQSFAGTDTDNIAVSADVLASCTITAGTMAFGTYDTITGSAVDQTLDLSIACTKGSIPIITLGQGLVPNASSTALVPLREMTDGAKVLAYNLFTDAGRTTAWDDDVTGDVVTYTAADNSATTTTIYGRVTASQDADVGNYTDTVVATVTF